MLTTSVPAAIIVIPATAAVTLVASASLAIIPTAISIGSWRVLVVVASAIASAAIVAIVIVGIPVSSVGSFHGASVRLSILLHQVCMLAGLAEEGIGGLDTIAFPHLNLSILNHMRHILAKEHLLQSLHGLYIALFERHEGKATAPARHLVAHDGDVDDLAKALKVRLHVRLYSHRHHEQSDKERDK